MAQILKPRFYINLLEYQKRIGVDLSLWKDVFYSIATQSNIIDGSINIPSSNLSTLCRGTDNEGFTMLLNYKSAEYNASFVKDGSSVDPSDKIAILNGWRLLYHTEFPNTIGFAIDGASAQVSVGCIIMGDYYDLEYPDMKITQTYNWGKQKEIKSYTGSTYYNNQFHVPKWGNLNPWELHDPDNNISNSGTAPQAKREWSLSFSYIQDSDVYPATQMQSKYGNQLGLNEEDLGILSADWDSTNDKFAKSWYQDDGIWSLYQKTLGGTIPFVMQLSNTNFSSDQFAMVKMKKNTIVFTRSSFKTYTFKVILEEVF